MQAAASRNHARQARALLAAYHRQGGAPQLWMFDSLVNVYARLKQLDEALALQAEMAGHGLEPSLCALAFFAHCWYQLDRRFDAASC